MSKPIHQQKWYAMPPDNAVHGEAAICGWQIAIETGELIVHEADRDAVEHIVALHNASLPIPSALTWTTRIRGIREVV